MKNQLLTLIMLAIIGLSNLVNAQTPQWVWAKSGTCTWVSNDNDYGTCITTDASGNVIAAGNMGSGYLSFDSVNVYAPGNIGIFIVKYDPSGNVLWARSSNGSYDRANSVTTDLNGNIIVTGRYENSITFDTITLTGSNGTNVFIAKYDQAGNILWAKTSTGGAFNLATCVATDPAGNVIVTGSFGNGPSFSFDTISLGQAQIHDVFLVKLDPAGNFLWAKKGAGDGIGNSVAADPSGNIMVVGSYKSNTITFSPAILTNFGDENFFIMKYGPTGNLLWANSEGGTETDIAYSVTSDKYGNFLVAGSFSSASLSLGTLTITRSGILPNYDVFFVKYSPTSQAIWANNAGGSVKDDRATCIATDSLGNYFVGGYFNTASFAIGPYTLTNTGTANLFIAKLDSGGIYKWAKSEVFTYNSKGFSVDPAGNPVITGGFGAQITIGNFTLYNGWMDEPDPYIAKMGYTTGIDENDALTDLNVYPNPFYLETNLQTKLPLKNATLTLSNVFGQTVKQIENITTQNIILNRDNLPCGVYFIQLKEAHKIISAKRIVISD